jgi:hypothetical protein
MILTVGCSIKSENDTKNQEINTKNQETNTKNDDKNDENDKIDDLEGVLFIYSMPKLILLQEIKGVCVYVYICVYYCYKYSFV